MPQPSATHPYLTSFGAGEFGDMTIQPLHAQNGDPNLDTSAMPGPSNVQQSVRRQDSSDSEADGDWDPYYSDSQSDSEDEGALTMQPVDPASIPTMDMAELGRLPRTARRPALSLHEMTREAKRLEPSITQDQLDEFFAGEMAQDFIRREPLALLRALEHPVKWFLRRRLGLPASAPIVGYVGHFNDVKGVDVLAEGFARLRARLPEATLGLVPDLTGTSNLVELVGYARAMEIALTGRAVRAAVVKRSRDVSSSRQ